MPDIQYAPPPLRDAATIILVRKNNAVPEIYLLKRNTKSKFMGGLYVFPGGVVDPEDRGAKAWAPYVDMNGDQIEAHLGGRGFSMEDALGFSIAAIRETLEEAGVFLAVPSDQARERLKDICTFRRNENLPCSWFKTRVMDEHWTLSLSTLGRWSHWITPQLMKKRFDTRFFVAFMPGDQACEPDNMETEHGLWLTPQSALEKNIDARVPLSPPAIVTLTQLLKFNTMDALKKELQTRSWADPIIPRLVPSPNGPVILEPWDPGFKTVHEIDTADFSKKILAPGSDFSRIWCDKGVWKPVDL